jgi:hypothetical protein
MKTTVLSALALVLLAGLFSGCVPTPAPANTATPLPPTSTPAPTIPPTARPSATLAPTASATLAYADPFDEIIARLEASDPQSPRYDPNSAAYAAFPQIVRQLAEKNAPENNGASMLAYALTFPRPDSTLAVQALISLGPDVTSTTMPILFGGLLDTRPQVRLYAMLALASVGKNASCAVGHIAPLLWDADPFVRSATAAALTSITGTDLLPPGYTFTPQPLSDQPVPADTPEGSYSGLAQKWWNRLGSQVNWHPSYDLCDP